MSQNPTNPFDLDPHVAELYDTVEVGLADVQFIRRLLGKAAGLRILEPFCGTGRVILPLAQDGHFVTGLDQSTGMLGRARLKLEALPAAVQERVTLTQMDVTEAAWPVGFGLVILGGNGLYELATPEEQESVVAAAAASLKAGGRLYLDSDHMEGDLDPAWRRSGRVRGALSGRCRDGAYVENFLEPVWFDAERRLVRFRRTTTVVLPDESQVEQVYEQQKHPVSRGEIEAWLQKHGFIILDVFGDRDGNAYSEKSARVIFWAEKA